MPFKTLSYGSYDGAELFNTDNPHTDGEQRWAAKADWFIRFWGYVFSEIAQASTLDPGTGRHMLFIDSADKKLTLRTGSTYTKYDTGDELKRYNLLMS